MIFAREITSIHLEHFPEVQLFPQSCLGMKKQGFYRASGKREMHKIVEVEFISLTHHLLNQAYRGCVST